MSNNPEYQRQWYAKNRERLLAVRRAYNKKWRESEHGKAFDKERNASPERKAYRKAYKKTEAGRLSERTRRARPIIVEKRYNHRLKVLYGITREDYENLIIAQEGKCAICKKLIEGLHVDHDHQTGIVRGLLCGSCNKGIGLFGDSIDLLANAITYLCR